ncbi:MAG TPA: LCP family protein [Thermoanaerobacterales bacterium]|nr:LCP family protein [Thermoanaerobacterales bacterium]
MKRPFKIALFILVFIAFSLASGFYYVYWSLKNPIEPGLDPDTPTSTDEFVKGGRQNILLLGMDAGTIGAKEEYNRYRTDTIMVISIDKKNKDVKILSVPRDTRVRIDGYGIQKINAAMAFGGTDLAVKTVKDFLGVPIHNYVAVKLSSFRNIVDALGGVEVDIQQPMKYSDPAGDIYINLSPGKQVLDGKKAEQFVRFRGYPEGDIGRIKAQQQFMEALVNTVLRPSTILKLPKLIDIVLDNVETDLQPLELANLANFARQIKQENIKMYMIPGEGKYISGISYFIPYQNQMNEMIDEIFFDDGSIKVAVLNGNGEQGIASKVASKLQSQGFKVVTVANADSFDYETTTIIYPSGKKNDAEKIAQVISEARIEEEADDSITLPTIIIGKDIN